MKTSSFINTAAIAAALLATQLVSAQDALILGPPNPNFEGGGGSWFSGASGASFVNFSEDGGFIENTGRANIGSDSTDGGADFRSSSFPLGPASHGEQPLTIEFYLKLAEPIAPGDQVRVQLRYFSADATSWVGEQNIDINDQNPLFDPNLVGEWQHFRQEGITATEPALFADIRVSANLFWDWSSGEVQFDAYQVTTPFPELPTPVAITHFPAEEVAFQAETGKRYRIESTTNGEDWTVESEIIIGNGQAFQRTFPKQDGEDRTFRVLTD